MHATQLFIDRSGVAYPMVMSSVPYAWGMLMSSVPHACMGKPKVFWE